VFELDLGWDRAARGNDNNLSEHVLRVRLRPAGGVSGIPLRVALAVDTSGSMEGPKLDAARRAVMALARALRPDDGLTLAGYAGAVTEVQPHVARSSLDLGALEGRLARLRAEGVTRTDLALDWLLRALPADGNTARLAVLVTDGHPTDPAGRVLPDVAFLVERAGRLGQAGATLCAVGLGDAADFNTALLNDLTVRGQGQFLYAEREHDLEPLVGDQLRRATSVVASEGRVTLQPLMRGIEVTACCQFTPVVRSMDCPTFTDGAWRIRLTGVRGDAPTDALIRVNVPPPGFGQGSSTRPALAVEAACGSAPPAQGQIDVTYTTSHLQQQQVNAEIDAARLQWDAVLYNDAILHSPSLTKTAEWLGELHRSAAGAGLADVARAAEQQLDALKRNGQVSAHLTARLSSSVQVPGGGA
jgi:Ca-activated chloride channel family protein